MLRKTSRLAVALAALSMTALPVVAEAHGGRGGWGGRGWGGRHYDGGDVLAGILILGGIAAIASAASKPKPRNDDRYDYPPEDTRNSDNRDYDNRAPDDRAPGGSYGAAPRDASRALDDAVDNCVNAAVGRGDVEQIYDVQRSGEGYRVSGDLSGGRRFSCMVDADGRVDLDVTGTRDAVPRSGF